MGGEHVDPIIEQFLSILSGSSAMSEIQEMYLFGSRARQDWRPDSDYDVLIVVEKKERRLTDAFYDAVIDVLLDTGRLISLKIFTSREFARLAAIPTPFMSHVLQEGKKLGLRH